MKAIKLPSGNYRAQAFDKYTGKRKSFTSPSKKEAERQATIWLATRSRPVLLTFGAAYDIFIAGRENTRSVTTIREYKRYRELYYGELLPVPISNLTDDLLQSFVNSLAVDKSPKTVLNIFSPVKTVIKLNDPSRIFHVALPARTRPDIYVPTEDEIHALVNEAAGSDMEIPILLASFCTLRRGEISALMAEDIVDGVIHVKASLAKKAQDVWVRKAPKSFAGSRYVKCPDFILEKLPKSGPVTPLNPDVITHRFEHNVKRAKVHDMHFHCLRHYCASKMISMGIPISDVRKIGGWDSRALEQIYMHSLEESRKKSEEIWMNFAADFSKK